MLEEKPDLFLVMVDSWEGDGRAYAVTAGDGAAKYSDAEQERNYATSLAVTEFAADRRKVCRMRTVEAALLVPDKHFDYVFIDADHSYEGCMADIVAWKSKVKPGGWLCGHDYDNRYHPEFGVKKAVDEYCAQHQFVLETDKNFTWFVRLGSTSQAIA